MFDAKWKKGNNLSVCVIAVALSLMVVLTFAGCGATDNGDANGGGSTGADNGDAGGGSTGGDTGSEPAGSGDTAIGNENASDGASASDASASSGEATPAAGAEVIDSGGSLSFSASDVTEQASFFPLTVDGIYMEVIAVRAPDDTVRTAFNTCQVCWDSGRGYYIQEADELVCQNCGNRFNVNDVEVVHGGCNPVPITEEYKTVDGDSVAIGYDLLKEAVPLFENWKS